MRFFSYPDKTCILAHLADHLVVGNERLAEYARQHHDRITIIPTFIELDSYPEKVRKKCPRNTRVVVGWIGTASNLTYLALVAPALRRLSQRYDFEFRVVANDARPLQPLDLGGVNVRFVPWQGSLGSGRGTRLRHWVDAAVPRRYLGPIPKCPTKLLQYMSVGIPGVASPVGMIGEVIEDGQNGLLAADDAGWERALKTHPQSSHLSAATRPTSARHTVRQRYSVEVHVPRYADAFPNKPSATAAHGHIERRGQHRIPTSWTPASLPRGDLLQRQSSWGYSAARDRRATQAASP